MAPGQRVEVADLPPEVREPRRPGRAAGVEPAAGSMALDRELAQALARGEREVGDRLEQEFEKTLIRRALAHTGGHRMEAARVARLGPQHADAQDPGARARAGAAQGPQP